jgi:phosphoribosylformylglycinamidine synthase
MSVYESFGYPEVTFEIAREMGMTEDEFNLAKKILGRNPNYIEVGIISSMWSEHCSYKSSKIHLKKFPTEAEWVIQGPGENAGIIEIDDDICACFKVESHNHPSYIEPYQGAATGVGGILRDIFTMGARPVAAMDSLRFGKLNNDETKYIVNGVVAGIAGYGNCFGVPTIGGETFFHQCYQKNPIVNAFALGLVKKERIFLAKAEGENNPIIYVGAKTGRDGIHGATMASEEFSSDSESKRPNVQIGDPFKEKLLLEACLELMKTDYIVGIQDMGAAGLTSSSFEMASKSGSGVVLDLDKVPVREKGMTPYEIMLSESQERMLMVVKKGYESKVKEIFDKWDLEVSVIGKVTSDGYVRLNWNNEEIACIPAKPLSDDAPIYDRPYRKPNSQKKLNDFMSSDIECPENLQDVFLKMLSSPNIASKRWIFKQYDHMVRTNTIILPGSDAAMIRIKESNKGIAMSSDCNSRYCYLNPYEGGIQAVVEAARNVAVSGARPKAITNCLNFGNPEKSDIMWQFIKSVEGMAKACKELNTPVVSGNVSLYNETEGNAIYPTPVVVMVGVIDNVENRLESSFKEFDSIIFLVGKTKDELGGSEYLEYIHGIVKGEPPEVDLKHEKKLIDFMIEGANGKIFLSAHDVSEGGVAVALAEMCLKNRVGAIVDLKSPYREDIAMFSESQGRVIVEVSKNNLEKMLSLLQKYSLDFEIIGKTDIKRLEISNCGFTLVDLPLRVVYDKYKRGMKDKLR